MSFKITILGSNSAVPAHGRHPSAQVVQLHNQVFLVDCGEGTQMRMNAFKIRRNRIEHIFISHLHGDHCFGLIGLLTTYQLNGRQKPICIYGPEGIAGLLDAHLTYCQTRFNFELKVQVVDTTKKSLLVDNDLISVYSFPLKHGVPTIGFLFKEKKLDRNILAEKIKEYQIPYSDIPGIKQGHDFVTPENVRIPNAELTKDSKEPRSYAYCSDTAYFSEVIAHIKEVDLLYHEATFMDDMLEFAAEKLHSTASQAAQIAKQANAKQLLIGHFSTRYPDLMPLLEEAKVVFSNTELAIEGRTFHIP